MTGVQWERLVRRRIRDADRGHVRLGLLILNKGVGFIQSMMGSQRKVLSPEMT